MSDSSPQETKVSFKDVIIDGIPSVEMNLEVDEEAKEFAEPTPAMWCAIYLAHQFKTGKFMEDVQEFVKNGQFAA